MKKVVTATDFKARSLALISEVEKDGEPITITRRGRPVAVLTVVPKEKWKSPAGSWQGRMKINGDIVNYDMADRWDIVSSKSSK